MVLQISTVLEPVGPATTSVPPSTLIPGCAAAFEALAFTHRKEHVRAVLEAKRPETRARRIAVAVEKLRVG